MNGDVGRKNMTNDNESPVCIATLASEIEAHIASLRLESLGIDTFITKDDCGGMRPWLQPITGVRLMVRQSDAQRAKDILKHKRKENE